MKKNQPILPKSQILKHFSKYDPVMAKVIRKSGPFVLKRNQKYFLVLCKSIIAQQISTKAAAAVTNRFLGLFERRSPSPGQVSVLDNEILRSVGLSRQKASYLKDLSRHFLKKSIYPNKFSYLENEEIIQQLTKVRGIGRWTAEMFLIFSLNRLNILPVDDWGLRSALRSIYKLEEAPTVQTIRAIAQPWTPYETVATWYAWRTLDSEITTY